MENNLCKVS
uniref:Uncharacterized protein n=1 Tax=Arundo donax TaxID=35708 RepID=A0A0A8XU09_ARUDO